ncbi:MAG: hypothetical protein AAF604_22150 [Acidobacteriota bacterium]
MTDIPDELSADLLGFDDEEADRLLKKAQGIDPAPKMTIPKVLGMTLTSEPKALTELDMLFTRLRANGLGDRIEEAREEARELAKRLHLSYPEAAERVMNRMIEEHGSNE